MIKYGKEKMLNFRHVFVSEWKKNSTISFTLVHATMGLISAVFKNFEQF